MTRLRLGACLADDMGLGKTIQVIDLLLRRRDDRDKHRDQEKVASVGPHLLVVPASLLGNWKQELARFRRNFACWWFTVRNATWKR